MTPKYRADVDGLRAVAVLSVLFFHAGSSLFSGGYVGVDVFFVISGYLITTIIVREIANDSFSIARFYERRFRRILPALTVVVAATLAVGSLLLNPRDLIDLGKSAIATALFSSNILFYFESGYFDAPAELKPLLHTWSLAVEEQYYIFFPLLLILIAKVDARHYLRWLLVLGSLSFAACVIQTQVDAAGAFYLIPTRAWELFMGSILALQVLPIPTSRRLREALSVLGILMIAYAVFRYTPDTSFPGVAATLPTLGTALVIHAGHGGDSVIARLLSLRPMVFVGLISYSLYLWHWPAIVFARYYSITEPSHATMSAAVAAIFALSVLSWRYVESPLRKKRILPHARGLVRASLAASLAIVAGGVVIVTFDGFPRRYGGAAAADVDTADPEWEHWQACEEATRERFDVQTLCDLGAPGGELRFVLWGDSHATALAAGVDASAKRLGLRGKIAAFPACPPLLSIERRNRISCHEFNQAVLKILSDTPELQTVILAARWAISTQGTRYRQETGKQVRLIDLSAPAARGLPNVALFELGLERTIERLHDLGKTVAIVKPIPEIGVDVPAAHFVALATGRDVDSLIAPTLADYARRTREVSAALAASTRGRALYVVDPADRLCGEAGCRVVDDDTPLYRDDDHLSTFGSKYLSPLFDRLFHDIAADRS